MALLICSVWRIRATSEKFRIIYITKDGSLAVGFPLPDDRKQLCKPFSLDVDEVSNQIQAGEIVADRFSMPAIMLQSEESISATDTAARDRRFECIQDLISDSEFIIKYCLAPRSKLVALHASNYGFDLRTVYRALRDYWRYGLCKNALIPLRANQGGPGKERVEGAEKKDDLQNPPLLASPSQVELILLLVTRLRLRRGIKNIMRRENQSFFQAPMKIR